MKLTKKQKAFVETVEKCEYLYMSEVDTTRYPTTLINALVEKGVLSINKSSKWDTNPKIVCLL